MDVLEQHPIEIVVTDLEMPEMNGLELVEAMQMDFEHIPAVLVTVQLLFGVHYLASKWILAEMEPPAWAMLRAGATLLVLGGATLLSRRRLPPKRDLLHLGYCGILGVTLNQAFFLEGIARTTIGHSSLLVSQIPTCALLTALLLRQERLTKRKVASFSAAFWGAAVLTIGNLLVSWLF